MACMCGDIYCNSCGPAQGNYKCRQCGKWSDEGGCDDPEKCDALETQAIEAEARAFEEDEKAAAEYWHQHPERF